MVHREGGDGRCKFSLTSFIKGPHAGDPQSSTFLFGFGSPGERGRTWDGHGRPDFLDHTGERLGNVRQLASSRPPNLKFFFQILPQFETRSEGAEHLALE